jgi:hypothetical protein
MKSETLKHSQQHSFFYWEVPFTDTTFCYRCDEAGIVQYKDHPSYSYWVGVAPSHIEHRESCGLLPSGVYDGWLKWRKLVRYHRTLVPEVVE